MSSTLTPAELAAKFAARPSGQGWDARCPLHEDRNPSLSIFARADGTAGLKCHAKSDCDPTAILATVGVMWSDLRPAPPSAGAREWQIRDAEGTLQAVHVRQDRPAGKRVWWKGADGSKGLGGRRASSLPLYRSETLRGAPPDATILIVEGEKAADAAAQLLGGYPMVVLGTVTGAAGCPDDEVLASCAGRQVLLWPDADQTGQRHMTKVAAGLHQVGAAAIRRVVWPAAPPKGDAADFVSARGTAAEMLALLDATVPLEPEPGATDGASTRGGQGRGGREDSAATEIVQLAHAAGVELFGADDVAYASVPVAGSFDTFPVRSRGFRRWLARQYFQSAGTAASGEAVGAAANVLEGEALFGGRPLRTVAVRLAGDDHEIFLDLGDAERRVVRITAAGLEVTTAVAGDIRFLRPAGLRALPVPVRGGTIGELRPFVNVATDSDFELLVGFLVGSLRPRGPYPVLALHGEQGSAKSTLARVVRELVDPASAPLRAQPRELRDLMIAAEHGWVVAFDNLSAIPPWLSDALCRLSTGGGFATRELYSDDDEVIFDAQRPVVLNGIEELATRGYLLDRALVLTLPPVADDQRRTEAEFWAAFNSASPAILGGPCDAVSCALRRLPEVHFDRLPRLADFAVWVTAAEPAFGWVDGTFVAGLAGTRTAAAGAELEASAVGPDLEAWATSLPTDQPWEGTAGVLLQLLEGRVAGGPEAARRRRGWPQSARSMAGALRRLGPALRQLGVHVQEPGRGDRPRRYTVAVGGVPPAPAPHRRAPLNSTPTVRRSRRWCAYPPGPRSSSCDCRPRVAGPPPGAGSAGGVTPEGRIRLRPAERVPTELVEELRACRSELLDELREAERWCRDPRPDLKEDSAVWARLLPATYRLDADDPRGLFGALHGLRCCGAQLRQDRRRRWRLEPLLDPTERLSIWQERSAWDLDCDRWLKPHLPELRCLLSELAEAPAPRSRPEPSAPRRRA